MKPVLLAINIVLFLGAASFHLDAVEVYDDKLIGEGSFGAVYKGFDEEKQMDVAVKVITPDEDGEEDLKLENSILEELQEYNEDLLVNTTEIVVDLDEDTHKMLTVYQIFPLLPYKLRPFLEEAPIEAPLVLNRIGYFLVKGLHNIHKHNIHHLDLKIDNILLDENLRPFICDFGLAQRDTGKKRYGRPGTVGYKSPEMMVDKYYYGDRNDIWSLGTILYKIFTGRRPINPDLFEDEDEHLRPIPEIKSLFKRFFDKKQNIPKEKFKYDLGIDWHDIVLNKMLVAEEMRITAEALVYLIEDRLEATGLDEIFENYVYQPNVPDEIEDDDSTAKSSSSLKRRNKFFRNRTKAECEY